MGEDPTLWLAAAFSSVSGIAGTWIGARRRSIEAKDKANELCRERLRAVRAESEQLAHALHELRMAVVTQLESEDELRTYIDDLLERWSHLE
jgi:uncharacterized membrane protein